MADVVTGSADVVTGSECKCIFPEVRRVLYRPQSCGASSTRCAGDRNSISQCPLCLAHSSIISRRRHGRQASLIDALLAAPLAIVGDSMSRQAFITLVTRLRGPDLPVVDFNLHGRCMAMRGCMAARYELYMAPMPPGSPSYARVADGYGVQHLPLDWLAPSKATNVSTKRPRRSIFDWAAERVLSEWHSVSASTAVHQQLPRVQSTAIGFFWAPCTYMLSDAAKEVHPTLLKSTPWKHVVYFAPAYWHLTGACGAKHHLNATREAVLNVWRPLLDQSNASLSYTVVSAPTENVGAESRQEHLRRLNALLRALFATGAFPPNWSLLDWAALTNRTVPYPTATPFGDQKHSWHYACQFYRQHSWYTMSTHHNVTLMTREGSGDCGEEANTLLWEKMLLKPQGRGGTRNSGGAASR